MDILDMVCIAYIFYDGWMMDIVQYVYSIYIFYDG